MASSTVRINKETQDLLREMARAEGASMRTVLEKALKDYRQKQFFAAVNATYARLKDDPKRWRQERAERRVWEAALADGLEED